MFRTILKQIWNQRLQNGWIFFELLLVGIFLWVVLDPLCSQTANKNIDRGYQQEGMYLLNMNKYAPNSHKYNKELDSDSLARLQYLDIIRAIRNLPEVESFSVTYDMSYANSGAFNGGAIFADSAFSLKKHYQAYFFCPVEGSDILRTYRFRDAQSGEVMTIAPDFATRNLIYISENLAQLLYDRTDVVGEKCYDYNKTEYEIAGVFKDYKDRDYNQPYPTALLTPYFSKSLRGSANMHWQNMIMFRIKDNVDADEFEHRFENEIKPTLARGNYYCTGISTFEEIALKTAHTFGELNQARKNFAFAIFGLLCVFLGIVGTFWVRANMRRQEIGVMRSIGASKSRIMLQYLTESGILVTAAILVSTIIMANYVYANGFFYYPSMVTLETIAADYWQNSPLLHFGVISGVVYLVTLLIALIGTYIPVSRTINELPSEALRDE